MNRIEMAKAFSLAERRKGQIRALELGEAPATAVRRVAHPESQGNFQG